MYSRNDSIYNNGNCSLYINQQQSSPETPAKYDISKTMGSSGTGYVVACNVIVHSLIIMCSVLLRTNYIALQTKTEGVYQYAVSFQ